jgi:hypothetical protein
MTENQNPQPEKVDPNYFNTDMQTFLKNNPDATPQEIKEFLLRKARLQSLGF